MDPVEIRPALIRANEEKLNGCFILLCWQEFVSTETITVAETLLSKKMRYLDNYRYAIDCNTHTSMTHS